MSKIKKIKSIKKVSNFNFDKKFKDEYRLQLFDRLQQLSSEPYLVIMGRDKKIGFEFEDVNIPYDIPRGFAERFEAKTYSKFAIVRLYPNNNPIMARVIGVMINKIFYIFYVQIGETGYKR